MCMETERETKTEGDIHRGSEGRKGKRKKGGQEVGKEEGDVYYKNSNPMITESVNWRARRW